MTDPTGFSPMVPGFEFMQSLMKSAGTALPGVGQWVTPTIDPEEIAKRIQELRTVQFWLEQNARMLGATIQAMEVQRMTLSTLKTMNLQMGDLQKAMTIRPTDLAPTAPTAFSASASASASTPAARPPAGSTPASPATSGGSGGGAESAAVAPGLVDPMQWWGALTRQFTELASNAMKDGSSEAARATGLAGAGSALSTAAAASPEAASLSPTGSPPSAAAASRPGKSAAGAAGSAASTAPGGSRKPATDR